MSKLKTMLLNNALSKELLKIIFRVDYIYLSLSIALFRCHCEGTRLVADVEGSETSSASTQKLPWRQEGSPYVPCMDRPPLIHFHRHVRRAGQRRPQSGVLSTSPTETMSFSTFMVRVSTQAMSGHSRFSWVLVWAPLGPGIVLRSCDRWERGIPSSLCPDSRLVHR